MEETNSTPVFNEVQKERIKNLVKTLGITEEEARKVLREGWIDVGGRDCRQRDPRAFTAKRRKECA